MTDDDERDDAVSALTAMATVINSGGSDDDIKRAWLEVSQTAFELFFYLGVEMTRADMKKEEE